MFNKNEGDSKAALRERFRVAHLLAKEAKPFSEGECVKRCILAVVEELCSEKKSVFETISLSRMSDTRIVEDLGKNLLLQLKTKANKFEIFSIALDKSTDIWDSVQLLVFISGVSSTFEVTEELAEMKSVHGTTTSQDIYEQVTDAIDSFELDWNKLLLITTDVARSMVRRRNELVDRIQNNMIDSNYKK